jgi:hypothetical protein
MVGGCAELVFLKLLLFSNFDPSRPPLASHSACRFTSPAYGVTTDHPFKVGDSWSCRGERMHPVRKDFGGLIRRKIGECMAQFQPNFEHVCHAALAQFAQEHQAR